MANFPFQFFWIGLQLISGWTPSGQTHALSSQNKTRDQPDYLGWAVIRTGICALFMCAIADKTKMTQTVFFSLLSHSVFCTRPHPIS